MIKHKYFQMSIQFRRPL